jgi:hypothetical protein
LLEFSNLRELAVSKTCLSAEGQATLLTQLGHLELLPRHAGILIDVTINELPKGIVNRVPNVVLLRGDYLCEALDWVAWDEIYKYQPYPVFNIRWFC